MNAHRSVASAIGYYQHGRVANNPAAKLLEQSCPPLGWPAR